jgi:hypothetical protein
MMKCTCADLMMAVTLLLAFAPAGAATCSSEWNCSLAFSDPGDMAHVTTNNAEHNCGGSLPVERVTGLPPDPAGLLRLRNLRDAAAKSPTFRHVVPARATFASDDNLCPGTIWLSVTFNYRFQSDNGTLLVHVFSGATEIQAASAPAPPPNQAGGYNMKWGFYMANLKLSSSAPGGSPFRVVLELRGPPPAEVRIDDLEIHASGSPTGWPSTSGVWTSFVSPKVWTPPPLDLVIRCVSNCADIAGPSTIYSVGPEDYLAAVYSFGQANNADPTKYGCADAEFTKDNVASLEDVEYFDWVEAYPDICSCGPGAGLSSFGMPAVPGLSSAADRDLTAPLLVAGKAYWYYPYDDLNFFLSDRIVGFDRSYRRVNVYRPWDEDRLNTRLVKDHLGRVCQLNVVRGLVRLTDGKVLLPCQRLRYGTSWVDVGWTRQKNSVPLQDATFDAAGDLYVVPVYVTPDGQTGYRAAARIRLDTQPANNKVVRLYGTVPDAHRYYPTGVHEIELDPAQYVYVLDKRQWKDSRLLRYDRESGQEKAFINVQNPAAFHVSRRDGRIVVADPCSLHFLNPAGFVLGQIDKNVEIKCLNESYITALAEESATGTLWVAGCALAYRPPTRDIGTGATRAYAPTFRPFLAQVPRAAVGPVQGVPASDYQADEGESLSLPLSILCTDGSF